jgi:hypothetical protein
MSFVTGRYDQPPATALWDGCKCPKLIVVEGMDEVSVLGVLLKRLIPHAEEMFQLYSADGKRRIAPFLDVLPQSPGFEALRCLAVVRDADDEPDGAFTSVRDALGRASLSAPEVPGQIAEGDPAVGVFIAPGAGQPGALEDMCLQAFAQAADPALPCVGAYLACISAAGIAIDRRSKALAMTFLASRPKQPARFGHIADRDDWPWDSPVWEPLKEFLLKL